MRLVTGRWSLLSIGIAALITAVALLLHQFTPGNAEWRGAYEGRGQGGAEAVTVIVEDAELTVATSAFFDDVECTEEGVFLLLTASYTFTDVGSFPRRGMTIDGVRYLPAACQDDDAGLSPVAGQQVAVDTVFVVDEETWEGIRGGDVHFQAAQFDPWYQSLGSRAVVEMAVPDELQDSVQAEGAR